MTKHIKNLALTFKQSLDIFNDIVFAFVCGSVARNTANRRSDIDFLICTTKKTNPQLREEFIRYYRRIHKSLKLKPDNLFPGEIMSVKELDTKLEKTKRSSPMNHIRNPELYDGIVWAGMLSSNYIYFRGNKAKFLKRRKVAKEIVIWWKREILRGFRSMPNDLFLKEIIQFKY